MGCGCRNCAGATGSPFVREADFEGPEMFEDEAAGAWPAGEATDEAVEAVEAGDFQGESPEIADFREDEAGPWTSAGADQEAGDYQQELEIVGPDTRVLVRDTTEAPYRYICNLEYLASGVGRAYCSGTLIGPSSVLTAGHCIHKPRTATLLSRHLIRVIPGRNGPLEPLPATAVTNLVPFPGYAESTVTDLAIVHLANPVGNAVGFWSADYSQPQGDRVGASILNGALPLPAGALKVNLSGYPGDKPAAQGCTHPAQPKRKCYVSRWTPARNALCGTYQYRAYDVTVNRKGDILRYTNDTCPAHSGSPVWVRRNPENGGRVMVAVHVSRNSEGGPIYNRGVLITPAIRAWIVANRI